MLVGLGAHPLTTLSSQLTHDKLPYLWASEEGSDPTVVRFPCSPVDESSGNPLKVPLLLYLGAALAA